MISNTYYSGQEPLNRVLGWNERSWKGQNYNIVTLC